jgi:hypothetical protein
VRVVTLAVTAPPVLADVSANACADGVVPDVGDRDRELAVVLDRLGLERPLEEVPAAPVPAVEVADARAEAGKPALICASSQLCAKRAREDSNL